MTLAKSEGFEQPSPLPADLVCPRCRQRLRAVDAESLRCLAGHSFPVIEGIPDLLGGEQSEPSNVLTPAVDLTIMVLAWNEADNLRSLLPQLREVVERMQVSYEVIVVDAGSTDGTPQVAAEAGARVARQSEPGYGGALRMGFSLARGRFIATMDGDHQHDPDFLGAMWTARENAGLVIASRYVEGGRADMPIYRKLFSRILNRVYGFGLGVNFRDMSSGFRLYRRSVINSIAIEGRNFDVLEDILLRIVADGHEVVEVPLHHKARFSGRSHVMLLQFVASYLRTFWRLRRLRNAPTSADYESWSLHSYNPMRRSRARRRMAQIASASAGSRRTLMLRAGADPLLAELPEAFSLDDRLNKLRWSRRFGRPVLRAAARSLPFPDASFDLVVWASAADAADLGEAALEVSRVLSSGGRLLLDLGATIRPRALAALHGLGFAATDDPSRAIVVLQKEGRSAPSVASKTSAAARIGLGTASISALQREYVNDVLDKNRLSYGEYTRRFEQEFARLHDRRYAIFCNSGTSALQVAVHALKERYGWKDGDEVLVPAVTFVASSNVIIQNGLTPVFVDVEADHVGIDPAQLQKHLTPRTRAIMPVHLFGQPCDMEAIMAFARAHDLRVIEDSCETMFVRYKGKPAGSWGDVACFSTYVAHLVVTGVGGFATTNDETLAVLMKSLMNHGRDSIYLSIDDDDTKDQTVLKQMVARRFSFIHVGYSYRATEMEAALGVGELARHQEMLSRRQANARYLNSALADLGRYLQLPSTRKGAEHAWMMYPVIVKDAVEREDLLLHLETAGIETRHLMPLINQPIYKKLFGDLEPQYPVAARINRCGFAIGCHQGLGQADLEHIVTAFHAYFAAKAKAA
jgi:perosamine synthetase